MSTKDSNAQRLTLVLFCAHEFGAVAPVKQNSKFPPLTPHGHNDASDDPVQIRAWFKQFPNCNWLLKCGRTVVVDVDLREDRNGEASLRALPAFSALPATVVVATPSGGRHYYFAANGHKIKSRNNYAPGVDIKAEGGYVLIPPSFIDGKPYRFIGGVE